MTEKIPFYDLHTHILPGMDDGCRDSNESIAVLKKEFEQGAAGIAATSHYYPKESIADFLRRRAYAWDVLRSAMEKELPEAESRIKLGAEVYYHRGLAADPDLDRLAMGKSRYLLLEMPFKQWSPSVLRDVEVILSSRGLRVVIAHLERFMKLTDRTSMQELLDMDVIVQVNSGNFLHFGTKRKAMRMVKDGIVQVLSSDTHNSSERPPNVGPALAVLRRGGCERELSRILAQGEKMFHRS